MRPKFRYSDLKTLPVIEKSINEEEKSEIIENEWMTPEKIPVKSIYTKDDLAGMEHLRYAAGLPPFLHGPYSGMYAMLPWTIRQYAGFSTAEDSNAFYRRNLACGAERLVSSIRSCYTQRI
jgi:methylmalonyl-CoA mutase